MSRDYFAVFGLTPGRYEPADISARFERLRRGLLAQLEDPRHHAASRRKLDELHIAYAVLRDPARQSEALNTFNDENATRELRTLVSASLEGGLLRYSRRQEILSYAREIGISQFHAQLLIAQVQFGDDRLLTVPRSERVSAGSEPYRAAQRLAAAGVLALALFLFMVRWLAV